MTMPTWAEHGAKAESGWSAGVTPVKTMTKLTYRLRCWFYPFCSKCERKTFFVPLFLIFNRKLVPLTLSDVFFIEYLTLGAGTLLCIRKTKACPGQPSYIGLPLLHLSEQRLAWSHCISALADSAIGLWSRFRLNIVSRAGRLIYWKCISTNQCLSWVEPAGEDLVFIISGHC